MKNFLLVNRASTGAKTNFNLIERLWTDSHEKQRVRGMRRYAAMITLLLTLACGQMWGDTTYKLVDDGSYTGYFITSKSLSSIASITIDGQTFSKAVSSWGNTITTATPEKYAGECSIDYDMKTTKTVFNIYVSGQNTSVYLHKLENGKPDTLVSQSTGTTDGVKLTYTVYATKNKRVLFTFGNTSLRVHQIEAVESGTALPVPGRAGYELNFDNARYSYSSGSSNVMKGIVDANGDTIEISSYNSYKYNSTQIELAKKDNKDNYIKFRTGASAANLKVIFSAGLLIVNTVKSSSGGTALTTNTAQALASNTTYYIINTHTTNRAVITKIAFEAAASGYTVTYDANGGTGTMTDSDSPYEAGATVTVLENEFTKPGYPFTGWSAVDEESNVIDVSSGSFTMPSSNVTITAQWGDALVDTFKDLEHGSEEGHGGSSGLIRTGANKATPKFTDFTPVNDYCNDLHYHFIGWVISTSVNDDGTLKNDAVIVPGGQSGWVCTGATYYAVWAAKNE